MERLPHSHVDERGYMYRSGLLWMRSFLTHELDPKEMSQAAIGLHTAIGRRRAPIPNHVEPSVFVAYLLQTIRPIFTEC